MKHLGCNRQASVSSIHTKHTLLFLRNMKPSPVIANGEINALVETNNGDLLVGTWGGGISIYAGRWEFKSTMHFNNVLFKEPDLCFIPHMMWYYMGRFPSTGTSILLILLVTHSARFVRRNWKTLPYDAWKKTSREIYGWDYIMAKLRNG